MACPIPLISTSPSSDSKFTQRSFALMIGWLLFSLPVAHVRASSFVQAAANTAAQSAQEPGEQSPLGLILCAGKSDEHVELLQKKLHEAIKLVRGRLARGQLLLESDL